MITRIACHLPDTVLTNEELAELYPGWTADKILQKTGGRQRHVVRSTTCASDLALASADGLLRDVADQLSPKAWRTVTWRQGTKGARASAATF